MTDSKKGKVIQMMNPENYIRHRARSLPLHECLVNTEWEDSQMVTVIVARKHSNNNITACLYLIDLLCQGVKDTFWYFNIPVSGYNEIKEEIKIKLELEEVNYVLAHNIIFAAVDFAEEYGFYPHRDFTSITKFMLEEDTDDIELIDIECGMEGKPAYMRTSNHTKAEAERIIAKLEKNACPGNYFIIDETDEFLSESDGEAEDEDDDDDYDDDPFNFRELSFEQRKTLFLEMSERFESLSENEREQYSDLSGFLFEDLCAEDEVDRHYDEIEEELKIPILPYNDVPDELLGISDRKSGYMPEIGRLFIDAYETVEENPAKGRKKLKTLQALAKNLPAVNFLELKLLQLNESKGYQGKLREYAGRHPDYALIKLMADADLMLHGELPLFSASSHGIKTYFPGRKALHCIEMMNYLEFKIFDLIRVNNPDRIQAYLKVILDYDLLPEKYLIVLLNLLAFARIRFVSDYFLKL
jgi:hypothetical protein